MEEVSNPTHFTLIAALAGSEGHGLLLGHNLLQGPDLLQGHNLLLGYNLLQLVSSASGKVHSSSVVCAHSVLCTLSGDGSLLAALKGGEADGSMMHSPLGTDGKPVYGEVTWRSINIPGSRLRCGWRRNTDVAGLCKGVGV